MKTSRGSRGTDPLVFNINAVWRPQCRSGPFGEEKNLLSSGIRTPIRPIHNLVTILTALSRRSVFRKYVIVTKAHTRTEFNSRHRIKLRISIYIFTRQCLYQTLSHLRYYS